MHIELIIFSNAELWMALKIKKIYLRNIMFVHFQAEVTEKKKIEEQHERARKRQRRHSNRRSGGGQRIEIWIHLDGSSSKDRVSEGESDEELNKLSTIEVNCSTLLKKINLFGSFSPTKYYT